MESTLAAQFKDLRGDVGHDQGYGRGPDFGDPEWDRRQLANITRFVKGGMRRFYNCGYDWSFLRPVATMTLPQGEVVVPLPDDYARPEGQIAVSTTGAINYTVLDFGGIGAVYQSAAVMPDTTGRPEMVCEEPLKGTTILNSSRRQLRFWPIADQDYILKFQYHLNPNYLTGDLPYAYGGPQHAETLLEACLAVGELINDDGNGPHNQAFTQLLEVSKVIDGKSKPQHLGYNGNGRAMLWTRRNIWSGQRITINGVEYD